MGSPSPAEIYYMIEHIGDNKVPGIIATSAVSMVAAYVAVGIRLYARRVGGVKLGGDDYFIMAALACTTAYVVALNVTTLYGMGRHVILVTDAFRFVVTAITAQCLYEVDILLIKFSILFLYHRIFPQVWFKRTLIALGTFILLNNTAQFFVNIFQCVPISFNWNPQGEGHCVNFGLHVLVEGILNIITDCAILVLPLPVLWNLKLSKLRKWQLSALFLVGGSVCIISIIRLFFVLVVGSKDPSWDDVEGAVISVVECCIAIISACIPTYRVLFNRQRRNGADPNSARWGSSTNPSHPKHSQTAAELPNWNHTPYVRANNNAEDAEQLYDSAVVNR